MKRPGVQLSHEVLVEEARFILKTLLRDDLFGKRVRLTEAERVLDTSISLTFADYCGFLNKYGYVRVDQLANTIEVTEGGASIAASGDDPEFQARVGRHFARELGTAQVRKPGAGPATDVGPAPSAISSRPREGAMEDVIDRRYRRGAVIGTGPIGSVFEGEHIGLSRPVAIKEARAIFQFASYLKRDEVVRRLRAAVQKQSTLVHPGIIQILDQNSEREFPYFTMEHATGGNLRRRMRAAGEGRMPLQIVVRILTQVCYALRFAHRQGVLHLGLKPENVLFDHFGNVKLTDFGFSRVLEREDDAAPAPVLVGPGTVAYIAPERMQATVDPARITAQADIYSIGILCYEMLTGKLPGRRSPLPSAARKDSPAAFDDVFDKMTRDDLGERYRSVDDVITGIYRAFSNKDVFSEGTILLWDKDPAPPPEPEAEHAPEPERIVSADSGNGSGVLPHAVQDLSSEAKTGEVQLNSAEEARKNRPPVPIGVRHKRKEP